MKNPFLKNTTGSYKVFGVKNSTNFTNFGTKPSSLPLMHTQIIVPSHEQQKSLLEK